MKFLRYDRSLPVPDFIPEWLSPQRLQALDAIDLNKMPLVDEDVRIARERRLSH